MFRISNNLIEILNFITFILSIPILAGGIWLSTRASTNCKKYYDGPIIALGVFLMVVSFAGLIGACCRAKWLLLVYLVVMLLLIVLLFCFTVFAFVVMKKGAEEVVSGKGYKEYRLGDYSNWLQKSVNKTKDWKRIRSCLDDSDICKKLGESNDTRAVFYQKKLSPIQLQICECEPEGTVTYSDADCSTWSNDQKTLCYNCQSCKGGVLANLKRNWKRIAIVNIIFLIIVYSVGCCAFRNNREDNAFPSWKGRP